MNGSFTRRTFLQGTGGALLAAPLLSSGRARQAQAQPANPKRCVFFHSPNGCLTNRWFPSVEQGVIDGAALSGTTLEPLAPFSSKLLVPRGLRAVNSFGAPQTIDPHAQAMGSKLTCSLIEEQAPYYAMGRSFDHEIARQLNPGGALPLVLSVGNSLSDGRSFLSYYSPLSPLNPEQNPANVYTALTGGLPEVGMHRLVREQTVLDAVRDDLATYQRHDLAEGDRQRVQAWLDLLRDTESAIVASCSADLDGVSAQTVAASSPGDLATSFTLGADMMMRLMALHMLCDTNRALVLYFPGFVTFAWDGLMHGADHAALAHRNGTGGSGGPCLDGVLERLYEIDRWYAGKYAFLVSLLDGISEGDGTLLDNTATVWIQEFADGNAHNQNNLPVVIAGSAGGYLNQGVSVNLEGSVLGAGDSEANCGPGGDGTVSVPTGSSSGSVPLNKLWVTLMNAVGCRAEDGGELREWGDFDGPSPENGIQDPGELSALRG